MRVLVTGAAGLVGADLVRYLADQPGYEVLAGVRRLSAANAWLQSLPAVQRVELGDLPALCLSPEGLRGVEVLVHCAARVHVMDEQAADPLAAFCAVNVDGTLALARLAAQAGVRRFVLLSTVKVHGESTEPGRPFTADAPLAPQDAYAQSKCEAESALLELASRTGLEVVIVRPPLVYGVGVKGNFARMLGWLWRGWPLPLARVQNRRSLVSLDNLVDLLACCMRHPAAAGRAFLVSDGEDLSTAGLLAELAEGMGRPLRLWSVRPGLLRMVARLLRRESVWQRLCGSLQVDMRSTQELLQWTPPLAVRPALRALAADYAGRQRS